MKHLFRNICIFLICIITPLIQINAQQIKRDVAISAYIYNFAKNVQWQNEESIQEFHFLVIGDDKNIIKELTTLSKTKTLRKKPIKVSSSTSLDNTDNIHLIFVTKESEGKLLKIYDKIEGKNILLISDSYDDKRIIMINFYDSKDGNLLFEINKANIINQRLNIMPDMVLLGGTTIDVAALYYEEQQSLRSLQKQIQSHDSTLNFLKKAITLKTKEAQANIQNLNEQTVKIQEQQKILDEQSLLLKKKEQELALKTLLIYEQQKLYERQKKELYDLSVNVSEGTELLNKQKKEIESKKAEIQLQTQALDKQGSQIVRQRNLITLFIIISILVAILVLTVFIAYKKIKKLNKSLEKRVSDRTQELNDANQQLQVELAERKLAEEALKKSEERFRLTLDNMLEGCQIIDYEWRYRYVNDAVISHGRQTKENMLGCKMMEVYSGFEKTEVFQVLSRCMNDRIPQHMINEFIYPDGTSAWFELSIQPVSEGIFVLSSDITERKLIENKIKQLNEELEKRVELRTQQLENANKELEAFAYSVSHDLRAPLRAISGFTKILTEDYANKIDTDGQRVCDVIQKEASRMGQLIDDLLSFSRLSRTSLQKVMTDMTKIVHQALEEVEGQYCENKIEIEITKLLPANVDISLIKQVWVNLISNAFKFSSKKDIIKIEVGSFENQGENIYFVKDNGSGFDMKYVDKLFGVFQRLHNINEFQGTGVGLAIVQRIIHRHGGRVWAEGEIDKGAKFYFSLLNKP